MWAGSFTASLPLFLLSFRQLLVCLVWQPSLTSGNGKDTSLLELGRLRVTKFNQAIDEGFAQSSTPSCRSLSAVQESSITTRLCNPFLLSIHCLIVRHVYSSS